jgi:hypothetical protein
MKTIWKVGTTAAAVAVLGGFFLGRVVAGETPLPDVGDPVNVGATTSPTPSADVPTLRPRNDRSPDARPSSPRSTEDDDGEDNSGPGNADDGDSDDDSRGRGRGRGRGGDDDDDVRTVGPSPSEIDDDDDDDDDDDSGSGSDDSDDDDD